MEGQETEEEYEKRIDGHVQAIVYFLDHPKAPLHPVVRAFVESMRSEVESGEQTMKQTTLN